MAVWGLDLIPQTVEDAINTTRRLPPRIHRTDGTGAQYTRRSGKKFNATILSTPPTRLISADVDVDALHNFTTNLITADAIISDFSTSKPTVTTKRAKHITHKKNVTGKATPKPKTWNRGNNTKYITKSERDLLPKSNMQVLQFYAQPLNPIELKAQPLPTFTGGGAGNAVLVKPGVNPMTALSHSQMYMPPTSFANSMPPINTVSYKTIPEEFVNSGGEGLPKALAFKPISYNPVGAERPVLSPLPILEPISVYKRKPIVPIQPQKFVATIRPVTSSVPMLPPVSVTRVYKYTEDGGPAFKLPFLDNEDAIDENLPVLSAALDDRLNDRVASISIRNYMTPPKLSQPIVYGAGVHATATLPDAYRNEFQVLNKFNENLRSPQAAYRPAEKPRSYDDDDEDMENDKENYSEEEVKKALKYIQRLKKSKPAPNRGRVTFESTEQHIRNIKRKPKGQHKKTKLEEEFDDDDLEPEQISSDSGKKKRKKDNNDPFHISELDDDDEIEDTTFQVKSFSEEPDRNQEESRTKAVKADAEVKPRSLELDDVPKVNEEVCVAMGTLDPLLGKGACVEIDLRGQYDSDRTCN
jgi:hypothetical protein